MLSNQIKTKLFILNTTVHNLHTDHNQVPSKGNFIITVLNTPILNRGHTMR